MYLFLYSFILRLGGRLNQIPEDADPARLDPHPKTNPHLKNPYAEFPLISSRELLESCLAACVFMN